MFLLNYQPNFARIEHGRARRINVMRRDLALVKKDAPRSLGYQRHESARQPSFDGSHRCGRRWPITPWINDVGRRCVCFKAS
jgi:hypothetical protein